MWLSERASNSITQSQQAKGRLYQQVNLAALLDPQKIDMAQ